MQTTEPLQLLHDLDFTGLVCIDADGLHLARRPDLQHLDGSPLSAQEQETFKRIPMPTFRSYVLSRARRLGANATPLDATLDHMIEVQQLLTPVWSEHPELGVHDAIAQLPPRQRARALSLVRVLEEETPLDA